MKINQSVSSTYSVIKFGSKYRLVKILGQYESKNEAYTDLVRIQERLVTEEEIEKTKWRARR
jgi:hypothetical protein